MRLSPNFSYDEMVVSQTATRRGIFNIPNSDQISNLKKTCELLERLRILLKAPIIITSGYRSIELNQAIGGSLKSHHCMGFAADFIAPKFGNPYQICQAITKSNIKFDQLILEGSWVHISAYPTLRMQVLTAEFEQGKSRYKQGLVA